MKNWIKGLCLVVIVMSETPCLGGEGEWQTMESAIQCRAQRSGGFQGCVNQAECGYDGHYLAEYSPEGLCRGCEFKRYPERFVACLFCRKPNLKCAANELSRNCLNCSQAVGKFLVNRLKASDAWEHEHTLDVFAHAAVRDAGNSIGKRSIPSFGDGTIERKIFPFFKNQLYIYRGVVLTENGKRVHVWVNSIEIDEADRKATAWGDESKDYVTAMCLKYNIFGPETGAVILDRMPDNVVAMYCEE